MGLYVLSQIGQFIIVNNCFTALTGYTNNDIKRMHILDSYYESEKEIYQQSRSYLNKHKNARFHRLIKCKDGTSFPAEVILNTINDGLVIGTIRNLEVENDLKEIAAESEERFREITDHM